MTMTMQPIKNEQAAALVSSKQPAYAAALGKAHNLPRFLQSVSVDDDKTVVYGDTKEVVLSGVAITTSAKDTATRLTALYDGKAARSLQAQAVRTSKVVEEQMESMKEKMDEIVNSYPPFLRGSEKRQQYLMSISSIRKQIEAMTLPPKLDQQSLDAASGKDAKKIWTNLFQNVDIPALDPNGQNEASDAQIRAASQVVGAMKSELSGRRSSLERLIAQAIPISSPTAQYISQAAGQGLAETGLSLTTNLTGALKGL